jgi:hypothetical protein
MKCSHITSSGAARSLCGAATTTTATSRQLAFGSPLRARDRVAQQPQRSHKEAKRAAVAGGHTAVQSIQPDSPATAYHSGLHMVFQSLLPQTRVCSANFPPLSTCLAFTMQLCLHLATNLRRHCYGSSNDVQKRPTGHQSLSAVSAPYTPGLEVVQHKEVDPSSHR